MIDSMFNVEQIMTLSQTYGYLFIFFIMIAEGPIITFITAFLASLGILNVYVIFILSVLGSFFPDMICFGIGRYGQKYVQKRIRDSKSSLLKTLKLVLTHIETNPLKTIAMIKVVPPLPVWGLILVGTTKMKFKKFVYYTLIVGAPYALFFTLAGFYSGFAFNKLFKYLQIGENILFFAVPIIILIAILLTFILRKIIKKGTVINEKDKYRLF